MMLAEISNFVVGRDRHGRWTAVAAGGRAGGFFVSRGAALRYARLETARKPGAVRQTSFPVQLPLSQDRVGSNGEGLPAWWRHGSPARGSESLWRSWTSTPPEGKGWLMLDIGIAMSFVLLCFAAGAMLS